MAVDPFIYIAHTVSYSKTKLKIQKCNLLSMRSGDFYAMYLQFNRKCIYKEFLQFDWSAIHSFLSLIHIQVFWCCCTLFSMQFVQCQVCFFLSLYSLIKKHYIIRGRYIVKHSVSLPPSLFLCLFSYRSSHTSKRPKHSYTTEGRL